MRYPPEQVDRLAAEYVLGTLRGAARRRMEALLRERADVRLAVWGWERALHGLTETLTPIAPPKSVWRNIKRRVGARKSSQPRASGWWPRMALASLAIAAVAFWLGTLVPTAQQVDRIAVFADESSQALWIISTDSANGNLVAETSGVSPATDNRVYELWALPGGAQPQSLGLLEISAGRYQTTIGPELLAAVERSAGLAISLEPAGGSPTGLPTGPIVYQASLVRL